jgi:transcriptional regulator with XRE-family HTH domain
MTEEELNKEIGARIAQLRRSRGLSQTELADQIDSEKQNISRLERGLVNPGIFFLYKISAAFNLTLTELLNLNE